MRTVELTEPEFLHDWGAAVHAMAFASPFFQRFGITERVRFEVPEISYGHALDGGQADIAFLYALRALEHGSPLSALRFADETAPAMLAGVFARSIGRLPSLGTGSAGLVFATLAHSSGWPMPVGGRRSQIALAEANVVEGGYPRSPYVLVSQPSRFDDSRAPAGMHTLWTYTHVPRGSARDMTETITKRIERFAPGLRDVILSSRSTPALALERGNANFVGGDIGTGALDLRQLLARPRFSSKPWRAGTGIYLCSAATPPCPGVHGMGGLYAASLALREVFGLRVPDLSPQSTPADDCRP